MNKKKFALMAASVALVASTVLFGTLAYFTDRESVANTFTVGNVDITLSEAKVNQYGEPEKDADDKIIRRQAGNEYKLVPGRTYTKDPTMTVAAGSEPAYVRMIVYVTAKDVVDKVFDAVKAVDNTITGPIDMFDKKNITDTHGTTPHWIMVTDTKVTSPGSIVYEFRYCDDSKTEDKAIVDARETGDITLPPLFEKFTVPGPISGDAVKELTDADMQIIVVGEAIQSDSFEADTANSLTAEEVAWQAFDAQVRFDTVYSGTTQP